MNFRLLLATALLVAAADGATKLLVVSEGFHASQLLAGVSIEPSKNPGIAFGFLAGWPTGLVTAVVGAVICVLLGMVWIAQDHISWAAGGLLVGGALANFVDRTADGFVTDFIDPARWPSFNIADAAIACGLVLLLWQPSTTGPDSEGEATGRTRLKR